MYADESTRRQTGYFSQKSLDARRLSAKSLLPAKLRYADDSARSKSVLHRHAQ